MVFGWLAALAMDTICHVAGESPVVYAEKEFERFMKSYEFAIEAQKLKREDVKDLVELIVSRMDMYHLVGALLLEFCVAFYGQFKLLEEGYKEEPDFILEIFLLCNICAIGYLLFAVWLSLHASVAAHAIGVEFLLESSRLTIPSPENLRQMRESTSVFRHIYSMFADPARQGVRPPGQAPVSTLRPSLAEHEFEHERAIVPAGGVQDDNATEHIHGQGQQLQVGPGKMPLALDSALDTMEHRHRFAESHRCWLRFDAYSRVCMALGINQMLQALSYFIVGPVQQKRPSSALLSLIAVQAIALLLLKLDLRNTEAETAPENGRDTDNESDAGSEMSKSSNGNAMFLDIGSKDVSVASSRDLLLTLSTYSLAPLWTTLALWTNRFTRHAQLLSVSVTPCFFLHAMWLFLVLRTISPSHGDLLPARLRTVGYLDIFTKDVLNPDDWEEDATGQKRKKSGGRSDRSGGSSPESRRPLRTFSVTFEKAQAEGVARSLAKGEKKPHHHHSRSAESVPWLVVKRFTITAIVMWIVGGIVHLAHTIYPHIEEYAKDLEEDAKDEEELRGRLRRLQAVWPEPAGFFEVNAIHCNSSHVAFSSPFALLTAQRLEGGSSLGPLAESGSADTHSMMCRDGSCHTLVPNNDGPSGGDRSWHLRPVGETAGAAPATVPVPKEWRVAAAAWLPCGAERCDSALLAGWDGGRIVISDMQQESDGLWSLDYRFAIRPEMGRERNCSRPRASFFGSRGGGHCNATELRDYEGVQAMQLSVTSTCQTLAVLLRNGTLDGWDLTAGTKLGTWRINSTLHTTMCHDGQDIFLTHPGDDSGPVVETVPLPAPLANCSAARQTEHDRIDINLATKQMFLKQASVDSLLQL